MNKYSQQLIFKMRLHDALGKISGTAIIQQHVNAERAKIALFTNVAREAVISAIDVDDIYRIPRVFQQQDLDDIVLRHFDIKAGEADLSDWDRVVEVRRHPEAEVNIAMVGKYVDLVDAYKSLNESLHHAGIQNRTSVKIH